MNAVGERNAGKLLVAFDEGLLGNASDLLYLDNQKEKPYRSN